MLDGIGLYREPWGKDIWQKASPVDAERDCVGKEAVSTLASIVIAFALSGFCSFQVYTGMVRV